MNLSKISIIILSYNSKTDLERLLPSIFASEGSINYEVIVIDNGSTDGTLDWLKATSYKLTAIANANNGFAHGNNLGIKASNGKYLLILNPDTRLEKDTLKTMYEFMESCSQVGISTCKVMLPNGKLDLACRRRFPNPWNSFLSLFGISKRGYNMLDTDENISQEIDACMGAFMFVRHSVLDKIGYFDESFFMYGEDLDLCWRVKEAGYKVWYNPKVFITHFKGSSSRKIAFKALKWFYDSMWIFYKKHYLAKYPVVFNWIVFVGIYSLYTYKFIINFFKFEPEVSSRG